MDQSKTQRGFSLGEFKDRYGVECSLQKSSIATEDCIWFGPNDGNPQVRVNKPGHGWKPIEIPEGHEYTDNSRMHLTRDMVKELIPHLIHFVDTGYLPDEDELATYDQVVVPPPETDESLKEKANKFWDEKGEALIERFEKEEDFGEENLDMETFCEEWKKKVHTFAEEVLEDWKRRRKYAADQIRTNELYLGPDQSKA